MRLTALLSVENTFTSADEPEQVYTRGSHGGKALRQKFLTAKILYGENSVRRNFRMAKNLYGEISVRRKIMTAKIP